MTKLDIDHALYFLNKLDPEENSRHTIASEAPYGKDGLPKWEGGATYNRNQLKYMVEDIIERQERKSNVYYSVNRPCKAGERQGWGGKNTIDDITKIRALAFDIDVLLSQEEVLKIIGEELYEDTQPSIIVYTGGGYHLIYLLDKMVDTYLYRLSKIDIERGKKITDEEKKINEKIILNRVAVTELARDFEHHLRDILPDNDKWKIDNMSNIDRVMRLPGTVNYPKAEKVKKGQVEAQSMIIFDSNQKCNLDRLRKIVPILSQKQSKSVKTPFIPSVEGGWTAYEKAKACCQYICDEAAADSNAWYSVNVMLPLIGAIHDENIHNRITIEEAEELFMLAISGGTRFNSAGRGERYFRRQWKSHHPELKRNGTKSIGGLIWAAKEIGMQIPWKDDLDGELRKEVEKQLAIHQELTDEQLVSILENYQR